MKRIGITQWCHDRIRQWINEPDLCIDATAGTGKDTLFLCELIGKQGKVIAFDIQEEAICETRQRLEKAGYSERAELICDGHENMAQYAEDKSVDLIMFNLGYLPGGDHQLSTKPETTIRAIEAGLQLLKSDGMMVLLIYSGGDSGFEERDALLPYLKQLDHKRYTVIKESFYNKPNDPPMPVYIFTNE